MPEDKMSGFWQTSDKVPRSTILAVTKKCSNNNCSLSARIEFTKLMGTSDYYDKDGYLHVCDCNPRTTRVCCEECWTEWNVSQTGDEVQEVIEVMKYGRETK